MACASALASGVSSSRTSSPSSLMPTATPDCSNAAAELARPVGADAHAQRPVVHQRPQLTEVAGRGEPALRHHEHARAEPLHLVEHVARDDHAAPLVAEPPEQRHHVRALPRVEARQRLVEQEHGGSWTIACATFTRCRMPFEYVGSFRGSAGSSSTSSSALPPPRRGRRSPCSVADRRDELARGQPFEDALLLRHEADRAGSRRRPRADRGRARGRCPARAARARTASAASSTCRRRSGRAAR